VVAHAGLAVVRIRGTQCVGIAPLMLAPVPRRGASDQADRDRLRLTTASPDRGPPTTQRYRRATDSRADGPGVASAIHGPVPSEASMMPASAQE
jgi:hypothetical protein